MKEETRRAWALFWSFDGSVMPDSKDSSTRWWADSPGTRFAYAAARKTLATDSARRRARPSR